MISRVLDTSVAIAWYLPESFTPQARRWRSRLLDGQARLLVPGFHYWELGNVLRTYVRRGEMEPALALEIYETHVQAPLDVVDPARETVLSTALDYGATVYDAVYITLALEQQTPLLTSERTTTPWIVKLGDLVESVATSSR